MCESIEIRLNRVKLLISEISMFWVSGLIGRLKGLFVS